MAFAAQPPPPSPPAGTSVNPQVGVTEVRISLEEAKKRHEARVEQINDAASESGSIAVRPLPMCSTAVAEGPMAEFLLDIHLDPYGDWNMLYLGTDDESAAALGTVPYSPSFATQFDDAILGGIMTAFGRWETAVEVVDPAALGSTRAQLRNELIDLTLGLQQDQLGDSQTRIRRLTNSER